MSLSLFSFIVETDAWRWIGFLMEWVKGGGCVAPIFLAWSAEIDLLVWSITWDRCCSEKLTSWQPCSSLNAALQSQDIIISFAQWLRHYTLFVYKVMLTANDSIINICIPSPKTRKRVTFDPVGKTSLLHQTRLSDMSLAVENGGQTRETTTTIKTGKYRKEIKLPSASGCEVFPLETV